MIKCAMILVDLFESEFKGKKYTISRFYNPLNSHIYTGSNVKDIIEQDIGTEFTCYLEYKNNKMKVIEVE